MEMEKTKLSDMEIRFRDKRTSKEGYIDLTKLTEFICEVISKSLEEYSKQSSPIKESEE